MFRDIFVVLSSPVPGGLANLINFPEVTLWFLKFSFLCLSLFMLGEGCESGLRGPVLIKSSPCFFIFSVLWCISASWLVFSCMHERACAFALDSLDKPRRDASHSICSQVAMWPRTKVSLSLLVHFDVWIRQNKATPAADLQPQNATGCISSS